MSVSWMVVVPISSVLGTWLGLTVIFQFLRPSDRLVRHQNLLPRYVIPKWTFFAPSPGRVDYRIVVQDYRTEDIPVGKGREINIHVERSLSHALWNPGKRQRKAVLDIAQLLQQLQQQSLKEPTVGIQMSTPYLAILNHMMTLEPSTNAAKLRRFLIVYTFGFDGAAFPRPVFVSSFHSLDSLHHLDG